MATPPGVPAEFWRTKDMQAALQSCHMGKVIRAFREHIQHGRRGYSQSDVAVWAHTSQARISRLENGPPILRLDHLDFWANLLGIPQDHLWFKLPENRDDRQGQARPAEDTLRTEIALGWHSDDRTADGSVMTDRPQRSSDVEREPDGASITEAAGPDGDRDLTPTLPNPPIHIDIETAQPARMGDYLSGGGANFSVDREVIEYLTDVLPGGSDAGRTMVRGLRAFVDKAVRYLAAEAGVRQFLDMGARIPTEPKLHEVARELAPDARFVFVIDDDTVMAHAHTLRDSTAPDASNYIRGDLHDLDRVLAEAAETLDFDEPLAVVIRGRFNFVSDQAVAKSIVNKLIDAVIPGSYLLLTHLASDIRADETAEAIKRAGQLAGQSKMPALTPRGHDEVAAFFEGLELIGPGVVPADQWEPTAASGVRPDESKTFMYGAVGRKP